MSSFQKPDTQGGSKSKLLIFSEYVNKTEKIGGTWTNTNSYRENEALSDIFTWNIYFTIVLYLNILWLKAVTDTTAGYYTTRQLLKHGVIKVCSIEYLIVEIELVLPTFKFYSHNYIEYLTLWLLSSHWNIYHSTTAYFLATLCNYYPLRGVVWSGICPLILSVIRGAADAFRVGCLWVGFGESCCSPSTKWGLGHCWSLTF